MQPPRVWSALSISTTLVERNLRRDCSFRVFSIHTHACNLLTDQGELIALVSSRHGNGPFHIVVPPALLTERRMGEVGVYQPRKLVFEKQQLAVDTATVWQPHLTPVRIPNIISPSFWLHETTSGYPVSLLFPTEEAITTPLRSRAATGLSALVHGLQQTNLDVVNKGIKALIGLGPGLTPAGDDFLVGFLAGLTLGPPATVVSAPSLSQLRTCIDKAADQTTRLSGAWLRCAAHGQFGETWHSLAHALQSGQRKKIEQAAHHILSTGATSGVDAMTGLLKAWEMAIAQGS